MMPSFTFVIAINTLVQAVYKADNFSLRFMNIFHHFYCKGGMNAQNIVKYLCKDLTKI